MKISLGNFDLMGGEVPAMAVIEAITRLIPGVIGKEEFLKERKIKQGFVEFPQYTRPAVFSPKKGVFWRVPKVLLSGNHQRIKEWREQRKKILEK
jgi:tRNA (guanine37-N1)-methyltransferase